MAKGRHRSAYRQYGGLIMADLLRRELRTIMDVWPKVLRQATDPWAKEFAASIWRQSGCPGWMPTDLQFQTMRVMLRQLLTDDEGEITLIE